MSFWIRTLHQPDRSYFYNFKKDISLNYEKNSRLKANFKICADSRYRLYINSNFIGEGPCQGSEYSRYYETFKDEEIIPHLRPGKNEIIVRVFHVQEGAFISVYRKSRPALWIDGEIQISSENQGLSPVSQSIVSIGTDETWECERLDHVSFHHFPGVHTSVPSGEEQQSQESFTKLKIEQFSVPSPGGFNIFGLADPYPLEPRPIPQLRYGKPKKLRLVRNKEDNNNNTKCQEYDAGKYVTALPSFELEAKPGSTAKISYHECYVVPDENGNYHKERRDAYDLEESELTGAVNDIVHIPETGIARFTPFWYRAFRFVKIEFSDPGGTLTAGTFRECYYPYDGAGDFRCSDPRLEEMWKISENTVKCCAHEMFVDCPYYEQQQYDMDSCLEMLFTQRMTGDSRLPFKSITDLSRSQIYNGMLQANYPSTMTQVIPNFTLFWVIMLREYVRYAPFCKETLVQTSALLGTMDKALEAFESFRDEATGLVGINPYWNFVDWVPGWHVGVTPGGHEGEPLTVSSMLYVKALRDAAEIAAYCGREYRCVEYLRRARALSQTIREKCYDKNAGMFKNTPYRYEYSEHTALWAVLGEIVTGEEAKKVLKNALDGENVARCSFSMGFFLFRAIEKANIYDEYAPRLFTGWQRMLDNHCTTWCENPDSPRSECHGWSSAPAYEFSAMILGAFPMDNGYRTIRIKPHLFALNTTWASGSVPTPFGPLYINLKRGTDPGFYSLKATLPDGSVFDRPVCHDGDEFLIRCS